METINPEKEGELLEVEAGGDWYRIEELQFRIQKLEARFMEILKIGAQELF